MAALLGDKGVKDASNKHPKLLKRQEKPLRLW